MNDMFSRKSNGRYPSGWAKKRGVGVFLWMLRGAFALCLFSFALVLSPLAASAQALHAEYVSSDPGANAVLRTAPTKITIHFSENVEPAGSTIQIYDVDGKLVTTASAQVDPTDLKTFSVSMKADTSELYVVVWRTISAVEGHHDSGSFRFFVNPSPMLSAMLNTSNGSSMGMSSSTSSSSTPTEVPPWTTALAAGLVGVLLGGIGSLVVRRTKAAQ